MEFDDIHVIPIDDCIEHTETEDCECRPEWVNKDEWMRTEADAKVFSHNLIREGEGVQ